MVSDGELTAAAEWRRYWPLALAGLTGFSFMSFMIPATGVFMGPLADEFGWNRTQLSSGQAVSAFLPLFLVPLIGVMIDKWGTRRIALPGIVLTGLAIAGFSQLNGSFVQWIGLWIAFGLCSLFVQSSVWSTAVASVFKAGRGLALGVTLSGTAVAQVVVPPLANWLIASVGWRAAFLWLAGGWGGLALLLSVLFLYDAHDARARASSKTGRTEAPDLPGLSVREARTNRSLWTVAIATFLILTVTIAVSVHQFPILLEAGVSRANAAWLVSLSGIAGVLGKLITGTLIDRFHARWVGSITLASTAIAYPLLLGFSAPTLIVVGMMISGYAAGTKIQLCGYLTARYAGMRNYGTIFGFMTSIITLASAVGPLSAGALHDRFGSYAPLLIGGVVISLVSGLLVLSLGRYPDWSSDRDANMEPGMQTA